MLLLSEQQQSARLAKELEAAKSALTALQEQQNPSLAEELKKTQQILASLQETEKKAREEKTRLEKMAESFLTVFSAFWRSARNTARYCSCVLIYVGTVSGRLKGGNLLLTNDQLFFQGVIKTSPGRSFLSEVPIFSARGKSKI